MRGTGLTQNIQWQHVPCIAIYIEYHHSAWFMICIDSCWYHYHPKIVIVLFQLIHVSSDHQTSNSARCQPWCNPYTQEFLIPSRLTEQYAYTQTCKIKMMGDNWLLTFFSVDVQFDKRECFHWMFSHCWCFRCWTCFNKTPPLHVGHGQFPPILDDHVVKVGSLKCHRKM